MPRLFYEDEEQHELAGQVLEGGAARGRKASRSKKQRYMEKVAKLIPAEVVAGYQALIGFVAGINPESVRAGFYWLAFVIGLVCTPLYMLWQSERGRPRGWHVSLSTGSFLVWAYAISGLHLVPTYYALLIRIRYVTSLRDGFSGCRITSLSGLAQIKKKETRKLGDSWANEIGG